MLSTEKVDGTAGWRSQKGLAGGREKLKGCLKTHVNGSSQRLSGCGVTATDGKGVVRSPGKPSQKGGESRTAFSRMNVWAETRGQVKCRCECAEAPVEGTEV